jgi:hypothetical protein
MLVLGQGVFIYPARRQSPGQQARDRSDEPHRPRVPIIAIVLSIVTAPSAVAVYAGRPDVTTNIFKPLSTPAESIYDISLLVLAICAAIFWLSAVS